MSEQEFIRTNWDQLLCGLQDWPQSFKYRCFMSPPQMNKQFMFALHADVSHLDSQTKLLLQPRCVCSHPHLGGHSLRAPWYTLVPLSYLKSQMNGAAAIHVTHHEHVGSLGFLFLSSKMISVFLGFAFFVSNLSHFLLLWYPSNLRNHCLV